MLPFPHFVTVAKDLCKSASHILLLLSRSLSQLSQGLCFIVWRQNISYFVPQHSTSITYSAYPSNKRLYSIKLYFSCSLRCCFYISVIDISHVPGTKQISCCHSGSRCQRLCSLFQLITFPRSTPFPLVLQLTEISPNFPTQQINASATDEQVWLPFKPHLLIHLAPDSLSHRLTVCSTSFIDECKFRGH